MYQSKGELHSNVKLHFFIVFPLLLIVLMLIYSVCRLVVLVMVRSDQNQMFPVTSGLLHDLQMKLSCTDISMSGRNDSGEWKLE